MELTQRPEIASPESRCGCSGQRWCALCLDPAIRAARKMKDPIPLPTMLDGHLGRGLKCENRHDASDEPVLFDPATQSVPGCPEFSGLIVLEDFVTAREEGELLEEFSRGRFKPAQSGKLKQHHGPKISFRRRRLNADRFEGVPAWAHVIEARARARLAEAAMTTAGLADALVRYVTTDVFILRYLERQGSNLDPHRDDTWAYGELILDLSLETDSWLTFLDRDPRERPREPFACIRAPLRARSLAVLFGSVRFEWHHGILAGDVQGRRTSVTLRTLGDSPAASDGGQRVLRLAQPRGAVFDPPP